MLGTQSAWAQQRKRPVKKKSYKKHRTYRKPVNQQLINAINSRPVEYTASDTTTADSLLCLARKYLGLPYRYGGATSQGFDCSGFVMFCFNHFNIQLPHTSGGQLNAGVRVKKKDARPGDIIAFMGSRRNRRYVGHSGIVYKVENDKIWFIHSAVAGGIRIDCLDAPYYKSRFLGISRVIPLP